VIVALINGHVIDVAVRVRIHMEEYEVTTPCRVLALAAETQELGLCGSRDGLAEVAVHVLGEAAAVEA
jgi:hypothetical protein